MDKWTTVKTVQRLMKLLFDNWDRLTVGEAFDKGVAKVCGKRTEGLEAGEDGVVVTLLRVEYEHVCKVALPGGQRIEGSASVYNEESLQDAIMAAFWQVAMELQKEAADEQG